MKRAAIFSIAAIIFAALMLSEAVPQPEKKTPAAPRYTATCVESYGTYSSPSLPSSNVMSSWKDKNGLLYLALKANQAKDDEGNISYSGGGIAIISPKGKKCILSGNSRPFFPGNTILHAWGDDEGKIYVSTGENGLVIIDTKKTPMNPADDTASQYTINGVFDTTNGGEPKVIGRSPCLGCDLTTYSYMDPTTKDLYVSAGHYDMQTSGQPCDTYEGGLMLLLWDKEKKNYTKSYIYRALNWRLKQTTRKKYQQALFDTTNAFDEKAGKSYGGDRIKNLKMFGENQNCHKVWKDEKTGLVYVCRRDTYIADREKIPGYNHDGGLTIIDTKKTRDPADDTVSALSLHTRPSICGSHVTDFWKDAATGYCYVSLLESNPEFDEELGGVAVLKGGGKGIAFRRSGLFDTTKNRKGSLLDKNAGVSSPYIHLTIQDPTTGNIVVFHLEGIDIIGKDLKTVSRISLDTIMNMPQDITKDGLWVISAWADKDGLIYVSTGEGNCGLLVMKIKKMR